VELFVVIAGTLLLESLALENQALEKYIHTAYLWPDPYSIIVNILGVIQTISLTKQFELVSTLYGPGNLACWFFLILSVVVS
jgi:hypothetical protein